MAAKDRAEKIAYAKELLMQGTRRTADLQKGVKAKFGTGMNFRDLRKVFPKKPGAKKKKKAAAATTPVTPVTTGTTPATPVKRGRGRPPKSAGRPQGASREPWLLLVQGQAEGFGGKRALETRVAELIAAGHAADSLAVYEKASMQLTLKTTVTL